MSELDDIPQRAAKIDSVQVDGDDILAVILEGEGVAVPVLVVCRSLGIDTTAQIDRLRNHEVMARGLRFVKAPINNRVRSVVAILHRYIPLWLAQINPAEVRADVRPKLVRYQEELVVVLDALYSPFATSALAAATLPDSEQAVLPATPSEIIPIARELRAMRDTLLALTRRQQAQEDRLDTVEDVVEELRKIVPVSPAQAEYLLRAIKRLAQQVERRGTNGANLYERLFAQFKIDMRVNEYKALPASRYDEALAWLRQQAAALLPDDPDALPPLQERLL